MECGMQFVFILIVCELIIHYCSTEQFAKVAVHYKLSEEKVEFKPSHDKYDFPFRDPSLPTEERLNDLISRLTLDEVVLQLSRGGANSNGPAPAIERLGISPYNWNAEGIHGYMAQTPSTGFPSPIGLAATFNKTAIRLMAEVVAVEARASHNNFTKHGYYSDHTGLSLFAPVINIMRHPLWGRNQETYGEDPVLTSYLARNYISGLQKRNIGGYPGATSVCKHFGVHSGPEDIPSSRFSFNAAVDDYNFGNTYMPAFRQCVLAGTYGVMCSYNAINGVPACANKLMISDTLREKFGFRGYVVSDEGAVEHIDTDFNFTENQLDTAVVSKNAGVDLELTNYGVNNRFALLGEAVRSGLVEEEDLRESARRLFYTRMRLGEFDPPGDNSWNDILTNDTLSASHQSLAADIAEGSYVLLKNDGLLPLKPFAGRIAFLGPFANNTDAVTGDYPTNPNGTYTTTMESWKGVSTLPPVVTPGCVGQWDKQLPLCDKYDSDSVKKSITSDVKLIVVTVGTGTSIEAESRDRANTSLPSNQYKLIQDAIEYARGIPVILLTYSAGPLLIDDAATNPAVNAIMACHFPAMSAGTLASLWTGQSVPAARLPYTWYRSNVQVPSMTSYNIRDVGLTYRYVPIGNALFPFGYGLSYTKFVYSALQVGPRHLTACEEVKVQVEVTNSGDYDADEVVQVYVSADGSNSEKLIQVQLVAFERVHVKRQSTMTVILTVEPFATAIWQPHNGESDDWDYYLPLATYTVHVGGQQPGQDNVVGSNLLQSSVQRSIRVLLSDCDMR